MMTGEFEFTDTLKGPEEKPTSSEAFLVKASRLLFFVAFIVAVSVGFFNLLTGFAVDELKVSYIDKRHNGLK